MVVCPCVHVCACVCLYGVVMSCMYVNVCVCGVHVCVFVHAVVSMGVFMC